MKKIKLFLRFVMLIMRTWIGSVHGWLSEFACPRAFVVKQCPLFVWRNNRITGLLIINICCPLLSGHDALYSANDYCCAKSCYWSWYSNNFVLYYWKGKVYYYWYVRWPREHNALQLQKTLLSIWQHTRCKCSQHNQKKKRCKYNVFGCVVSICSVFLYLFALWAFAPSAVKMMKIFSWFAGAFSICMCFLKLQRVELSRPP